MSEYDFEFEPVQLDTNDDPFATTHGLAPPPSRLVVASEEEWHKLECFCVEGVRDKFGYFNPAKILIKAETLFSGDANKGGIVDDQGRHCFEVDGESTKLSDIQNRLHETLKDTKAEVWVDFGNGTTKVDPKLLIPRWQELKRNEFKS
jgi:hypothetical protein